MKTLAPVETLVVVEMLAAVEMLVVVEMLAVVKTGGTKVGSGRALRLCGENGRAG